MRRLAFILLFVAVTGPSICVANPDGPTGSIVFAPKYSFTDKNHSSQTLFEANWRAGFSVLVPAGRYATVRFDLEGGDVSSQVARARVDSKIRFEFSVRLYIPLTGSAKEKLRNWDTRR